MHLHFLEARVPLVKEYTKTNEGYDKTSYPMVQQVSSHLEEVNTPLEFFSALKYHSRNNHCLLKGKLSKRLDFESRAGLVDGMDRTSWLCLDFDYLSSESQVESVLYSMGLGDVSYILQYGAGHLIDKEFSAHLFIMLKQEVLPQQIKYWLMHHNLTNSIFEKSIQLSRSNAALLWPLDVSVAHNHMLLYIAPPVCNGFDDPVEDGRIRLVEKANSKIDILNSVNTIDAAVVENLKQEKLNELRKKKGLKARTFTTKVVSGIEVLSKPGVATVTGQKEARGFMYLNINNGDSWGYYHPTDNPEVLHNFKGEPNYLTKELLPEYYKNYKAMIRKRAQEEQGDLVFLAFLDRTSDQYFRGTFDPRKKKVEVFQTSSIKKLEDFLRQNNQWVGEFVEEWDYVFRFEDPRICVPEEKFLNRYQETSYLQEARLAPTPKHFPPTIQKILLSVVGGDPLIMKRFLNWAAFIVQKRRMTKTGWVFHGTQGTGKGLLMNKIMSPIIGSNAVQVKLMSELEDNFNGYMEECVMLLIDEAEQRQLRQESRTMARLKNAITDENIPIRRMNTGHYTAKNYMNVMIASNHRTAVNIEDGDRRFNVGNYQETRLMMTDAEVDKIEQELFDFTNILYRINVVESDLRSPMDTEGRKSMQSMSMTAIGTVFKYVREGNLQEIMNIMPTSKSPAAKDGIDRIALDQARDFLAQAERLARRSESHFVERDELHNLMVVLIKDSVPNAPSKFVHQGRFYGVHMDNHKGDVGINVMWTPPEYSILKDKKLELVK